MYGLLVFAGMIILTAGLWILVPILYGVPWRPTEDDRIRKALRMAGLKQGEILYDLGSGDGRVLIIAAREFGAFGVGIEVGPMQVMLSKFKILLKGVNSKVCVRWDDFFQANLREADVVFAYLTSDQVQPLQKQFEGQLRRGARVVTISCDLPGWQPNAFERDDLIFLYNIPFIAGNLTSFLEQSI